jgi:hypothetical protein
MQQHEIAGRSYVSAENHGNPRRKISAVQVK